MTVLQTNNLRQYSSFLPLNQELIFEKEKNYLFDLSYLTLLEVEGSQPLEFLQGQLTCDTREVNATQTRTGAQCNLKGRVLSLLTILQWHGVKLLLPKDLAEVTLASLSKTALLSKTAIAQNDSYHLFGLFVQNQQDILPGNCSLPCETNTVSSNETQLIYKVSESFYIILVSHSVVDFSRPYSRKNQFRGSHAWHYLQLGQLRMEVYPASRGLFLPHRLNLHLSSIVSFNKGCYKGQEIIARTHYLAKQKYNLQLLTLESTVKPIPGQLLVSSKSLSSQGEVIDCCLEKDNQYLVLASLLLDNSNNVSLKLKEC